MLEFLLPLPDSGELQPLYCLLKFQEAEPECAGPAPGQGTGGPGCGGEVQDVQYACFAV